MPAAFIGREALERQTAEGVSRRLVGLKLPGRAIARHGYPVLHDGAVVGEVTSGTWSPTLAEAIALAYVPAAAGEGWARSWRWRSGARPSRPRGEAPLLPPGLRGGHAAHLGLRA